MDKINIGMPRSLLYYKQFPFWQTFFEKLGARVVVSPKTNSDILNLGLNVANSEICLPVKVFFGHSLLLADTCDYVFVPRVVSIEQDAYTCPKFLGLPDMIKALPGSPKILSVDINAKKNKRETRKSIFQLGKKINKSSVAIQSAYISAKREIRKFHLAKMAGNMAHDILESKNIARATGKLKIGVIGHPYNLYDPHISLNFIERLRHQGVELKTLETVAPKEITKQTKTLPKSIFWSYEKEVVGAALHWLRNKSVDGIIHVLAFACGPDSLMQVVIEDEARRHPDTPLMPLVIDEHSAEAGFLTRLEAFTDMLMYKKNKQEEAVAT